jgi:hypothetical protein
MSIEDDWWELRKKERAYIKNLKKISFALENHFFILKK